jgi:regulator of nonsense transcripts 3
MSKQPAPRLKLVVRRLPPTLPEDVFWRAVAPFVEGKSVWRRFVKGRAGDKCV